MMKSVYHKALALMSVVVMIQFLMILGVLSPEAWADTNLLTNPGFESDITGWELGDGNQAVRNSDPSPHSGDAYLIGSSGKASSYTSQVIDLIANGLSEQDIDSGLYSVHFGGWQAGWETQTDKGKIEIILSDRTSDLASDDLGWFYSNHTWTLKEGRIGLVPGTRYITFGFHALRDSGTNNDAYLDDAFVFVSSSSDSTFVDLNLWTETDYTDDFSSGEWEISDDGLTVTQHINSAPTFFISDFNFIDSHFEGSFRVDTEEDDDFIGFVFGFQGLGENLGYYLLSWKKESQINAEEGFKLLKVWGIPDNVTEVDISTEIGDGENSDHITVLASQVGNDTGWSSYKDYSFHLTYRQDGNMRVIISDALSNDILWNTGLVNDSDPLGPGKVGFFNNSQEEVTYSGFTKITMLPPVAVPGYPYVFDETTSNITLDATGSYDPDGEQSGFDAIVSLQWDIGNDGIVDDQGRINPLENITLQELLAKGLAVGVDVPVKLTVVDADGLENSNIGMIRYKDSEQSDGSVTNFTANKTSGNAPLTVEFTDISTGSPTSWEWDFNNDGIIDSTLQNPLFNYHNQGTYSVKLTVKIEDTDYEVLKTGYITVDEPVNPLPILPWMSL